ncbi:MAG: membrane protein insertion efficiency factor YidD [Kofleriaceae bacterium]
MLAFVKFYRRWLSPLKRRSTCRYLPTCSQYAIQALTTHGAAKGSALTVARILRCNPFFHPGYHPVPKAGAWVAGEHEGH